MKLTLRTVSGGTSTHDVAPEDSVGSLKQRLAEEYDLPTLKLCHKGKVLEDAKSFGELGFGDAETLIIAGKKKAISAKPAEPKPTQDTKPVEQASSSGAQQATPNSPPQGESIPAAPQPQPQPQPQPSASASSAPSAPGVDESVVEGIMAMGFTDRAEVIRALRCAYMNPDRAVEYLFSGIPPSVAAQFDNQPANQPAHPPSRAPPAPAPTQQSGGQQGGGMNAEQLAAMMNSMQSQQQGGSELERALRAIPQFEQIRALVRSNPQALPAVMQQLQQHSPELFALVQANPQEFLNLMNSGPAPQGGATEGSGEGPQVMRVTQADLEPIQRLVALGGGMWDERAATIVYLACRRNEELAANVLFDNGGLPAELADVAMQEGDGDEAPEE